jgi:hypothetical protein
VVKALFDSILSVCALDGAMEFSVRSKWQLLASQKVQFWVEIEVDMTLVRRDSVAWFVFEEGIVNLKKVGDRCFVLISASMLS